MILGILSDTHGRERAAAAAVQTLRDAGAEALVHCGDVGGMGVLDELVGLPAWFVRGNTDEPGPLLIDYARSIGVNPPTDVPLHIELDGRSLVVFHGHELRFAWLADLANMGRTDRLEAALDGASYVLSGHTHTRHDERIGSVRFINPGAVYRARPPTVATLDLQTDTLRFWPVELEGARRPQLDDLPLAQ